MRNSLANDDEEEEEEDDRKIFLASVLLDDVVVGRHVEFRTDKIRSYVLYKRREFRFCFYVAIGVYLALAAFENPAIHSLRLPFWITVIAELTCLTYFAFRLIHEATFTSLKVFWKDPKHWGVAILLGLSLVDILVYTALNERGVRFSRPLRPLFFVNFPEGRQIRQAFRNIRRTLPEIFGVLILLMLSIAIFTLMGYKLFCQKNLVKANGDPYFANYMDTFWDMYVLVTSANNPDLMMPAYDYSRFYALFFVTYIVITLYVFMNVVLAVIYNNYKTNLRNDITDFYRRKRELLIRIFELSSTFAASDVDTENGSVLENRFLFKNNFTKLLRATFPGRTSQYYDCLWLILDTNNDNRIDFSEFSQLDDLIHIPYTDEKDQRTFLERTFPHFYNSRISEWIKTGVRHIAFRYCFDAIIIINGFFIAMDLDGAEWYFLSLFSLEIILKVYTFGPVLFIKKLWNIFDLFVVSSALLISVVQELQHEFSESAVSLDVLLALRVLRLFKIFHSIRRFRTVLNTILYIVPSLATYGSILMIFYYFFALVGMEVFSHKIQSISFTDLETTPNLEVSIFCGNDLLQNSSFYADRYCSNNFNNVFSSFVVLFELMVVNQWHVLTEGYVIVTGTNWTRIYFFSFHLVCVTVILNIYTAFVLEAFIMEYTICHSTSTLSRKINDMGLGIASKRSNSRNKNGGGDEDVIIVDADHSDIQFKDDIGCVEDDEESNSRRNSHHRDVSKETTIRFSLSSRPRTGYKLLEKMFCQEMKEMHHPMF